MHGACHAQPQACPCHGLVPYAFTRTGYIKRQNRVLGPTAYAVLQWGRLPPTFLSHVQMRALVRAFT